MNTNNHKINRMLLYLVFVFLSLFTVFPFYWTLSLSTHTTSEIYSSVSFGFGDAFLDNLHSLLNTNQFVVSYINSIVVAILHTILAIFISALTGYTLDKFVFRGKKSIFVFILATMMIPGQVGLVAFIWQMSKMGLMNTLYPLIFAGVAFPFGVFWMKQYIESAVATEMLEAARIDGCGELTIFLRIVLPVILPATVSLGLIVFISNWNSFLLPVLVLQEPEKFTIPVTIANLGNLYTRDYGTQFLGLLLSVIPLILLFIFTSRRLIDGITAGAVKG